MPGMSHPLTLRSPLVVGAFHAALLHQALELLAIGVAVALAWNVSLAVQQRRSAAGGQPTEAASSTPGRAALEPEPQGRRFLRTAFGLLWVLDGLLQLQSAMPIGMPTGVARAAASGSPVWVHDVVGLGIGIWSDHPVEAASSVVWIQVGLGLALLVAPRGRWSRAAGSASVAWALVVWVFGEAFGGVFAPGQSWAFGLPGAVVLYAVAGVLVALPERSWRGPKVGRWTVAGIGVCFAAMALLQGWPGRGSWTSSGRSPMAAMLRTMAKTPQPRMLARWVSSFASLDAAHGVAVNGVLVAALALTGLLLVAGALAGRRRLVLAGWSVGVLLCLATWVLVQDLGFLGGLGTDPNSMVPTVLLLSGGVVALLRAPSSVREPALVPAGALEVARGRLRRLPEVFTPAVLGRLGLAVFSAAVVLVGAVPMAAASLDPTASPILAEALNGSPGTLDALAPGFTLTDQDGERVSLASLRGKAVALTFLDPVCSLTCPLIARSFALADRMLGAEARRTELVAVAANPVYHSVAATRAFDRQEHLTTMPNWLYLTGSLRQLTHVWDAYGVQVTTLPAGAMVAHSFVAFIIDPDGRLRAALGTNPGNTARASASMSALVADELRATLSA